MTYWFIALTAYCFFTYQAVLAGGVEKAVGKSTRNGVEPWFFVWLILGAAWPISVPAALVIRAAMLRRK